MVQESSISEIHDEANNSTFVASYISACGEFGLYPREVTGASSTITGQVIISFTNDQKGQVRG